jgi:uncharacterized protein (DUF302 family)
MAEGPVGPDGVIHRHSPYSVDETVARLSAAVEAAGAKVFVVVDHSGEAEAAGMSLRDTKVVVFGSPRGGTPVMQASPVAALDLPLKVLVWVDDGATVWMTFATAAWLGQRHQIPDHLLGPLGAADALTAQVAGSA